MEIYKYFYWLKISSRLFQYSSRVNMQELVKLQFQFYIKDNFLIPRIVKG